MALTMCTQEVIFLNNLLTELKLQEMPAKVYGDNTGAIFLVDNKQVRGRTKYIDIRHHFMRKRKEKGEVVYKHMDGVENTSDILTKNLPDMTFRKHVTKIMGGTIFTEGECQITQD